MAQFDVYANTNPDTKKIVPYLLDIQADLLEDLATHVVVPLIPFSVMGKAAKHLNPVFTIKKTKVVMSTSELAGVPTRILGEKVASLNDYRNEIIAALDFLFTGY
ncbi:MAG: CcdB family protein [Proteobacteria bacterium]|nr:CcdB family protein [Pseudomonadota bacterium]